MQAECEYVHVLYIEPNNHPHIAIDCNVETAISKGAWLVSL